MLIAYITCSCHTEAEKISKSLLEKRLCACVNILKGMQSIYFWPPKSNTLEKSEEVVLIAKTVDEKIKELEKEVKKLHSYSCPYIFAIDVKYVSKEYEKWLIDELK